MFSTVLLASTDMPTVILSVIIALIIGALVGFFVRVKIHDGSIAKSKTEAETIISDAKTRGEKMQKDLLREAKDEIRTLRQENDSYCKDLRSQVKDLEQKVNAREDSLDRRSANLDKREDTLNSKEDRLDERKIQLDENEELVNSRLEESERKLNEIAGLSQDEAKNIVMEQVKTSMSGEIATYIKDEEVKARDEAKRKAKNLLALAIQKYASETVSESTVSVVSLPTDEMKGRIIGREGRNIRTLESLTGVDLIIDDTPDAVVLSCFDPIRREIAKKSLEILVSDGRIHPARIEEIVERSRSEVEMFVREKGEEAVFNVGIGKVHPDLVRLIGRLNYRTSYGQNVLDHSIETAMLAGKMAAEIGENEILARRAGLLHDIGKAVDHEIEGSHVDIGVELAKKYREPKEVIDAIASHHEDVPPKSIIAVLVAAADALSSARPGARSDSFENYIKRLEDLESISNSVKGVANSFAVQAGREIRVIVDPSGVDDASTFKIAREIKEKIENTLSYPGTIKVTVVRETRAVDVAK